MNNQKKGVIGESLVYDLATNSFLSYWCYANPKDELGNKKEICDLLIHFNGILILVCVKNYQFKGIYSRYFRKSIEKDVRQLYGAEKKILTSNYDIEVKTKEGRKHIIRKEDITKTHRVIVHLGEKVHFYPFNRNTKAEKFVHIFDKNSFVNLTDFLDTIKDFVEYLDKREQAFGDKEVLILPSEEDEFDLNTHKQFMELQTRKEWIKKNILISGTESDILAHYIKNGRKFSEQLTSEKYDGMLFQIDGNWDEFINKQKVQKKLQDDKVSYFIDEFVKREVLPNPNEQSLKFAREILSFNRFDRRIISKNLFSFAEDYNNTKGSYLARRYGEIDGIAIIFVFYTTDMTQEQVNFLLPVVIETYAVYTKYKHKKVILIGATNDCKQFKFGYDEIEPFSKEDEELTRENIKALKWFTNINEIKFNEFEYPDTKE